MKAILSHAKSEIKDFGNRKLNEEDFFRECETRGIIVVEAPLFSCDGVTYSVNGQTIIGIATRLKGNDRLKVLWHEFAHAIFHVPEVALGAWFSGVKVEGDLAEKECEVEEFVRAAMMLDGESGV